MSRSRNIIYSMTMILIILSGSSIIMHMMSIIGISTAIIIVCVRCIVVIVITISIILSISSTLRASGGLATLTLG